MDLFNNKPIDWKTFDKTLTKLLSLIENLEKQNKMLKEKSKGLEEKMKKFEKVKRDMEGKIKKLINKIETIKE